MMKRSYTVLIILLFLVIFMDISVEFTALNHDFKFKMNSIVTMLTGSDRTWVSLNWNPTE